MMHEPCGAKAQDPGPGSRVEWPGDPPRVVEAGPWTPQRPRGVYANRETVLGPGEPKRASRPLEAAGSSSKVQELSRIRERAAIKGA